MLLPAPVAKVKQLKIDRYEMQLINYNVNIDNLWLHLGRLKAECGPSGGSEPSPKKQELHPLILDSESRIRNCFWQCLICTQQKGK
jgi:hypothetical protein